MPNRHRYPPEIKERAVRLVFEHEHAYPSHWKAICSIAEKSDLHPETLRQWVRRAERDEAASRPDHRRAPAHARAREREQGTAPRQRDPQGRSQFLRGGARPPTGEMVEFIDRHKMRWRVEPICKELPIAPSTYYAAKKRPPSDRTLRDEYLKGEIKRVWKENFEVYGADKIWTQLNREGIRVARCTVERLMREARHSGCPQGPPARHHHRRQHHHHTSRRPRKPCVQCAGSQPVMAL